MWVESNLGAGSTLFFACVVEIGPTDVTHIIPKLRQNWQHQVLSIDSGQTDCVESISDAIKEFNLVLRILSNGTAAWSSELGKADAYGCVIVDDGKTAKRLRDTERFRYIPIVMLAPSISASLKDSLEHGIVSYMATPCLPVDLGNALIPAL
jgi:osomolarity two-component system sensor histidine kinase NIK1